MNMPRLKSQFSKFASVACIVCVAGCFLLIGIDNFSSNSVVSALTIGLFAVMAGTAAARALEDVSNHGPKIVVLSAVVGFLIEPISKMIGHPVHGPQVWGVLMITGGLWMTVSAIQRKIAIGEQNAA